MQASVPLAEQVEAAQDDRLRVLGAGIAGTSVVRLLRVQGLHPVFLERSMPSAAGGYMLGLMPLVDEPLRRLGAWPAYCERSVDTNCDLAATGWSAPTRWMRRWPSTDGTAASSAAS